MLQEKKLVVVLGSMGRGGAERVVSIISNFYANKGWKVYLVLLLANKVDYELNENVEVIDLSGKTTSRIKRIPNWFFGVRRVVKEINPDTVLSFAARINIIVQIALKGLKKKIVVSERNDPYSDGRSKMIDFFTNRLYPKAYKVVFQTKRAKGYFEKCKLENDCIISNPIEVKCEATELKKGKIVTAGRLTAQKNHKMLLNAFKIVADKFDYATLHIFGDGELKEELTALADSLGVADKVFFEGNVPNIHERIADANVFVLSSDYEGLSNALLEAMMMGLTCVSTDCAGSDEYIVDGENGRLVKVGDAENMAKALIEVLSDDEKAKALGQKAKISSAEFEKSNVLKLWENVLD